VCFSNKRSWNLTLIKCITLEVKRKTHDEFISSLAFPHAEINIWKEILKHYVYLLPFFCFCLLIYLCTFGTVMDTVNKHSCTEVLLWLRHHYSSSMPHHQLQYTKSKSNTEAVLQLIKSINQWVIFDHSWQQLRLRRYLFIFYQGILKQL